MKLEKNQTFVISHEPYIVGVVRRLKCARDNRWVISATDGNEYIYNGNTGSWSRGDYNFVEFEALTNSNLLNSTSCGCEEDCECNREPLDLVSGQVWEDEGSNRVLILDMSLNGNYFGHESTDEREHYYILGIHVDRGLDGNGPVEYYNNQGISFGLIPDSKNLSSLIADKIDFTLV